eukprot:comp22017_c0_seq1/m.31891 comp22017_c0_seq1/g.31891  ORF comp22017_c0_seq1/g.31891 comp22017_c0_seq1/m.31891 type:complete len:335 (-) comp22017_c0_seq1:965-1969(-)
MSSHARTTLFIAGFGPRTTQIELEEEFSRWGRMVRCQMIAGKNFAFIEYETESDAERALQKTRDLFKTVEFAKTPMIPRGPPREHIPALERGPRGVGDRDSLYDRRRALSPPRSYGGAGSLGLNRGLRDRLGAGFGHDDRLTSREPDRFAPAASSRYAEPAATRRPGLRFDDDRADDRFRTDRDRDFDRRPLERSAVSDFRRDDLYSRPAGGRLDDFASSRLPLSRVRDDYRDEPVRPRVGDFIGRPRDPYAAPARAPLLRRDDYAPVRRDDLDRRRDDLPGRFDRDTRGPADTLRLRERSRSPIGRRSPPPVRRDDFADIDRRPSRILGRSAY